MAQPVLVLRDVTVRRGTSTLLDGVDWTVNDGERWAVLGSNGAGKTTLLQVAATMLWPTSGSIEVLGEPLDPAAGVTADVYELRPRIGFASSAIGERMPPGELVRDAVVTAGYAVLGRGSEYYDPADDLRALKLLDQLGCGRVAERAYGTLSEGERKRVQIARALMADPELLLLDEPAAGLDLGAREALMRRLTRVMASPEGPVLVMVSHHVEEIPPGVTHVLLLRGGAVTAAGPINEILTGEHLSRCYGLPLAVDALAGGRYAARLAPPRRLDSLPPPVGQPVQLDAPTPSAESVRYAV
jgi:iron complex transport system ATP-binding protein